MNTRNSRSGDDDYKVVNSALDNLLASRGEIFIDFSKKEVSESCRRAFFLVEVRLPNNQSDSFVGRIDNYVFALSNVFRCRHLFQTKVGKFGVTIEMKFIDVVTAFMNKKI